MPASIHISVSPAHTPTCTESEAALLRGEVGVLEDAVAAREARVESLESQLRESRAVDNCHDRETQLLRTQIEELEEEVRAAKAAGRERSPFEAFSGASFTTDFLDQSREQLQAMATSHTVRTDCGKWE